MKIIKRCVDQAVHMKLCIQYSLGPRYSEFESLHHKLVTTFPHAVGSIPPLPPKSVVCKSPARPHYRSPHLPHRPSSDIDVAK